MDYYNNNERTLRLQVRVLYVLCLLMMGMALYAAHCARKAADESWFWHYQFTNNVMVPK